MKSNKVLEKLQITRRTLSSYVKSGKIRVSKLDNGFYNYNDSDVEQLAKNANLKNKVMIFFNGSIMTYNFNEKQIQDVISYCNELNSHNR